MTGLATKQRPTLADPVEGFWTPSRVEMLNAGFLAGLSWARIAKRIGDNCTRLQVSGKAWRMGLKRGEAGRIEQLQAHNNQVNRAKLLVRPDTILSSRVWAATERSISLVLLTPKTCRWPVGLATGADQLFCGESVEAGQTYCPTCRLRNTERGAA